MFCLYCGSNLPEDAVFCNTCGRRQNAAESPLARRPFQNGGKLNAR